MTRTLPLRSALVVLLASLAVAPAASARPDSAARLQMVWPASGTVTARFGEWRGSHRHNGIDIGMLRTLRLRSVYAGTVKRIGYASGYEGYGKIIVLDLPGPYTALYAHLASVRVRPGQTLFRQGDPVTDVYLVRLGYVRVSIRQFEDEARVISLGPGTILGEIGPRTRYDGDDGLIPLPPQGGRPRFSDRSRLIHASHPRN